MRQADPNKSPRFTHTPFSTLVLLLSPLIWTPLVLWFNLSFDEVRAENHKKLHFDFLHASRGWPFMPAETWRQVDYQTGAGQIRDGWPLNDDTLPLLTNTRVFAVNLACALVCSLQVCHSRLRNSREQF